MAATKKKLKPEDGAPAGSRKGKNMNVRMRGEEVLWVNEAVARSGLNKQDYLRLLVLSGIGKTEIVSELIRAHKTGMELG